MNPYWKTLEQRRDDLGISFAALSERSGVSAPTLKRLFSGKADNPTLQSLQSVCKILDVDLIVNTEIEVKPRQSTEEVRQTVAREKAEQLVRLVQGTSALESQSVGRSDVRDMIARTVHELLAGPSRRLWSQ